MLSIIWTQYYFFSLHLNKSKFKLGGGFSSSPALVIMCLIKTFSLASHPLEETKFGILLKLSSQNFLAIVFTDIYKQIQFPVCSKRRQQRKTALREFL